MSTTSASVRGGFLFLEIVMDSSVIPEGMYCYSYTGEVNNNGMPIKINCPYWSLDKTHQDQDNGYCHYLGEGSSRLNKS